MNQKDSGDVLISHLDDLREQCENKCRITASNFLTEEEQATALSHIHGCNFFLYGGYPEAERKCLVFLPDYLSEEDVAAEPKLAGIGFLKVALPSFYEDTVIKHSDILGSLMGTGIKREVIGDIIQDGNGAIVVIRSKISDFLLDEISRIGRYECETSFTETAEITLNKQFEIKKESVSSMRLDCVVAAVFNISRGIAAEAIGEGFVSVGGVCENKADRNVHDGSKISFRGHGKAEIRITDSLSKKGKIIIEAKKYK